MRQQDLNQISYNFPDLKIVIKLAKACGKQWKNKSLQKKVLACRKAYLRYGKVPLLDKFDKKSDVYLIECLNKKHADKKAEYFSIRFVHAGKKKPYATEDFLHFGHKNISLDSILKKHKIKLNTLATISKFCRQKAKQTNLKFTQLAFCLANKFFLETHPEIKYLTGLFRNEVINKSLKKNNLPKFTKAKASLDFNLKINRSVSAYKFPGYFLNLSDLQTVIKNLVNSYQITAPTLNFYLGKRLTTQILSGESLKIEQTKLLPKLLLAFGQLKNARISGEKLREILNTKVKDGPDFYFLYKEPWLNSINKFLNEF